MTAPVALARGSGHPLVLAAALALGGDVPPGNPTPCRTEGVSVQVYEDSRLLDGPSERLELVRGRALACDHPRARLVLEALDGAIGGLPEQRWKEPVRLHLDPRLPPRQAPLRGVEVHVTSRDVLLDSARLGSLGPEAWRHELLHALAASPPPGPAPLRRLWLTLEEGVVEYLTHTAESAWDRSDVDAGSALGSDSDTEMRVLPLLEWLASPAYDPHPLAAGLARELDRAAPEVVLDPWLDCLAAEPTALRGGAGADARGVDAPLPASLAWVFDAFVARCSQEVGSTFSRAVTGWWGAAPAARGLRSDRAAAERPESH